MARPPVHVANDSSEQRRAAEANGQAFAATVVGRGRVTPRIVKFRNEKRDSIAARSSANLFADESTIEPYTDVVIDISAMPRVVYFPLISRLVYFHDDLRKVGKPAPDVHVI